LNRQGGLVRRIKMHQEKDRKRKEDDVIPKGAVPSYLLDRQAVTAVARRLPMTVPSFVLPGRVLRVPKFFRTPSSRSGKSVLANGTCRSLLCDRWLRTR
jgi:hypothetical protein